ncbi:MAG: Rieske 2Fe-2S domain-containing protein [Chloroflexota bacterium]
MDPVIPSWRRQFPYGLEADEVVARREFLRYALLSSGALFIGSVVLAVLAPLQRRSAEPKAVARVNELRAGEARYFHYPGPQDEAVLINTRERGLVAYSQKCTHLSCSVVYQAERDRLFCPCHDGVFSPLTGDPVAGPPQRRLPRIVLEQRGDDIYAVDLTP